MKTPAEAREQLCQALESGEYKQGQSFLEHKEEGVVFDCCLGVACREYIKDGGQLKITYTPQTNGSCVVIFDDDLYQLPDKVRIWLGFAESNGSLHNSGSLMLMNDAGISFLKIAKTIREGKVKCADA